MLARADVDCTAAILSAMHATAEKGGKKASYVLGGLPAATATQVVLSGAMQPAALKPMLNHLQVDTLMALLADMPNDAAARVVVRSPNPNPDPLEMLAFQHGVSLELPTLTLNLTQPQLYVVL